MVRTEAPAQSESRRQTATPHTAGRASPRLYTHPEQTRFVHHRFNFAVRFAASSTLHRPRPDGRSALAEENWPATRWVKPYNKPRRVGDYFPVLV